jgi:hypothetical protein
MKSPKVVATSIVLLLAAAPTAGGQGAGTFASCSGSGLLTPQGIGLLRIGLSPDSLKKVCRVIGERRVVEYEMTQFQVRVGSDTLLVDERAGRIFWIEVRSQAFRMADSLGVGSPLGRLDLDGLAGGVGDGADTYALSPARGPSCGLVFWIDSATATTISEIARGNPAFVNGPPNGPVRDALRRRANTGTIRSIDIRGCS